MTEQVSTRASWLNALRAGAGATLGRTSMVEIAGSHAREIIELAWTGVFAAINPATLAFPIRLPACPARRFPLGPGIATCVA
jgi:hypothetical protein